jgi:hypothetical protein
MWHMRTLVGIMLSVFLLGCDCDSICEAHKETEKPLSQEHSNTEIVEFLNSYIGEAPGAEKYAVFVNWGTSRPERFIEIMNQPNVTKRTMYLVTYKISDMGHSETYCKIFSNRKETENEQYIRKSLLGCQYGL